MQLLRFFTIVLGSATIILTYTTWWIQKAFGPVSMEQIIWHVVNSQLTVGEIDPDYISRGIHFTLLALLFTLIWVFFICYGTHIVAFTVKIFWKRKNKIGASDIYTKNVWHKMLICLFTISSIACITIVCCINSKFNVYSYINNTYYVDSDDAYEKLYAVPKFQDIRFEKTNNLVIILAESMEKTFSDIAGVSCTPHLDTIKNFSTHNDATYPVFGTEWTIASMTAWHFGLPLRTPGIGGGNQYISHTGFLPNAVSIFDILKKKGYETVLLMGSSKHFAGCDILFSGHGNFRILDKIYFEKIGWQLDQHKGTNWGFNDSFLLERAAEEYERLEQANKPFVLFIQTIDTHMPDGYCPEEKKNTMIYATLL